MPNGRSGRFITKEIWKEIDAILLRYGIPATTHFEGEDKHIQINLVISDYFDERRFDMKKRKFDESGRELVTDENGHEVSPIDDDYEYYKSQILSPLDDDYCKYDYE